MVDKDHQYPDLKVMAELWSSTLLFDKDHQYPDLKVMADLWSSTLLLYHHFCTPNPELW